MQRDLILPRQSGYQQTEHSKLWLLIPD